MVKRYSFICAHPDDLEFFSGMFVRLAVKNGHDVEIVSMTKGEYGTLNPAMKGDKLGQIRARELQNASKLHGVPKNKVKFLGLHDGGVTLEKAVSVLRKYIQERKPDVIFTPEHAFSLYTHADHLITGTATCRLIKYEFTSPRPLLFAYHSYKNTHFIKCDLLSTGKALGEHKTQVQVIGLLYPLRWIFNIMNGFFYCRRFLFMEACRQVFFDRKLKISFLDRFFHAFYNLGKLIFRAWSDEES